MVKQIKHNKRVMFNIETTNKNKKIKAEKGIDINNIRSKGFRGKVSHTL